VATLHFAGTDVKVFTPVSAALGALSNGPGTIITLVRQTTAGGDMAGLTNSAASLWYHALGVHNSGNGNVLWDDNGVTSVLGITSQNTNLTNWKMFALDWGSTTAIESFHFRNQTTLSAWSHENSSVTNALRAGPGTSGFFRIGYFADILIGAMDVGLVAVWAGTRFASADYGSWSKTSDLYNHARGNPTLLCELNSSTLVDIGDNPSTYSSGNSTGTALTGPNPDNWTFDGTGAVADDTTKPALAGMFTPQLRQDAWF
jgi:hypothetical protein